MSGASDRISELCIVLDRLSGLYDELAGMAREKVMHMGRADLAALREDVSREEGLVRKAQEQDGLRRQLLELIGKGLGIAPQIARRMTSSQLLLRMEPGRRPEVERVVRKLRKAASALSEANRVTGLVSAQVLTHLREVFAAISRPDDGPVVYTPTGRTTPGGARRIFETTG
jgi:hypothetical protein